MWLTTVMEVLFTGAVISLVADFGAKWYGARRGLVIGLVSALTLALSLIMVLLYWPATSAGYTSVQPVLSSLASLYVVDRFSVFTALAVLVIGSSRQSTRGATSVPETTRVPSMPCCSS